MKVKDFFNLFKHTDFTMNVHDDENHKKVVPVKFKLEHFGSGSYPLSYFTDTFVFEIITEVECKLVSRITEFKSLSDISDEVLEMELSEVVSMRTGAYMSTSSSGNKYFGNTFGFRLKVRHIF
ncbi:hypothetical protein [Paracholeplasma manati]|uniref:hypothetical protein n=1 Tax=Paracholeplasma manati TaxID=591373 RepID=UPI00240833F0|nr:hypothetical protein [Paracholeplasma manati]MDG0888307.1 hypothetical protein [Paracholeplasma manati]